MRARSQKRAARGDRGSALLVVMSAAAILFITAAAVVGVVVFQQTQQARAQAVVRATSLAHQGMEVYLTALRIDPNYRTRVPYIAGIGEDGTWTVAADVTANSITAVGRDSRSGLYHVIRATVQNQNFSGYTVISDSPLSLGNGMRNLTLSGAVRSNSTVTLNRSFPLLAVEYAAGTVVNSSNAGMGTLRVSPIDFARAGSSFPNMYTAASSGRAGTTWNIGSIPGDTSGKIAAAMPKPLAFYRDPSDPSRNYWAATSSPSDQSPTGYGSQPDLVGVGIDFSKADGADPNTGLFYVRSVWAPNVDGSPAKTGADAPTRQQFIEFARTNPVWNPNRFGEGVLGVNNGRSYEITPRGLNPNGNNVVYVGGDFDVYVKGEYSRSVTIVSERDIYIMGSLTRDPSAPATTTLGLVAKGNIYICGGMPTQAGVEATYSAAGGVVNSYTGRTFLRGASTFASRGELMPDSPDEEVRIQAAMLSVNGAIVMDPEDVVSSPNPPALRTGTLHIQGSLAAAQGIQGPNFANEYNATLGGFTNVILEYDGVLTENPPPLFPQLGAGSLKIINWDEYDTTKDPNEGLDFPEPVDYRPQASVLAWSMEPTYTPSGDDSQKPITISNAESQYLGEARITLTAVDFGIAGVSKTFYRIDGGEWCEGPTIDLPPYPNVGVSGVGGPAPNTSATHTVEFYSVDRDGNEENPQAVTIRIVGLDTIEPESTVQDSSNPTFALPDGYPQVGKPDYVVYGTFYPVFTATDTTEGSGAYQMVVVQKNDPQHISGYVDPDPPAYELRRNEGEDLTTPLVYSLPGVSFPPTGFMVRRFEYYAIDSVGNRERTNTLTILQHAPDLTAPITFFDAKPVYIGPATIHLTGIDDVEGQGMGDTFYSLDGGPWTRSTANPTTITVAAPEFGSEPATHTLSFYSRDISPALNTEATQTVSFTVSPPLADDTTPPETVSDALASYIGSATITLTPSDEGGVADTLWILDGAAPVSGVKIQIPAPWTGSDDHSLVFWSKDYRGNTEVAHEVTFTVYPENVPPISSAHNLDLYAGPAIFQVTATDNDDGSGVAETYFKIDDGPFQIAPGLTGLTWVTVTGDGLHTVTYYSVDNSGNAETPKTCTFRIDTTPPTTTDDNEGSYVGQASVSLDATDTGSGVAEIQWRNAADGIVHTGSPVLLGPGTWDVMYWAIDRAGNIEEPNSIHVAVAASPDITAPDSYDDIDTYYKYPAPAALKLYAWDVQSGVSNLFYRIDTSTVVTLEGKENPPASYDIYYSVDGTHTVEYWSVDASGNVEAPHHTATFVLDTAFPKTKCSARSGQTYWATQTFNLTATDVGTGVKATYYALDGGVPVRGTTVYVPAPMDGYSRPHVIQYWSVDVAGNVEAVNTVAFTSKPTDLTPPTTFSNAQKNYHGPSMIQLSAYDNVGGSGVAHTFYRVDTGTIIEGTILEVTGSGTHTLEFWSTDYAGNTETPHKTVTYTIDGQAPTTTSDIKPFYNQYDGSALIHLTATDQGGSDVLATYYRVDGGAVATGTPPVTTITVTPEGPHSIEYWSVDNAGNEEIPHVTQTFKIDKTSPVSHAVAVAPSYAGTATITLQASDEANGSGLAFTKYRVDGGTATSGTVITIPQPTSGPTTRTITFWSQDNAGNIELVQSVSFRQTPVANMTFSGATPPENSTITIRNPLVAVTASSDTTIAGVTAMLDGVAVSPTLVYQVLAPSGSPKSFFYTAGDQTFVVPTGVTQLTVDLWGAQGGDFEYSGGWGGGVHAVIPVTPGQVLTIKVGGADGGWPNGSAGGGCGVGGGASTSILLGGSVLVEAGGGGGADHAGGDGGAGGWQGSGAGGLQSGAESDDGGAGGGGGWNGGGAGSRHNYGGDGGSSYIAVGTGALYPGANPGDGMATLSWGGSSGGENKTVATASFQTSGLLNGAHTVEFMFTNSAGASKPKAWTFYVNAAPDVTPPTTTSDAQQYYTSGAVISLNATDGVGNTDVKNTYYRLDGGATVTGTPPTTVIPVAAAGRHTLEFWSVDGAGNVETHKTNVFWIDWVPPTTYAGALSAYAGTATVYLSPVDNAGGSGVKFTYYKLDSGTWLAPTLGSSTVGQWRFDEATGSALADLSSNGYSATAAAGSSGTQSSVGQMWTNGASGRFGSSLNFDGIDDYVNIGSKTAINNLGPSFSAAAWVKTSVNSGTQTIVGRQNDWRLEKTGNAYYFEHRNSTNNVVYAGKVNTSTDWVYVVGTFDANTGLARLFLNGELVSEVPQSGTTRVSQTANEIGANNAWHAGNVYYNDFFWNGQIDEVVLSNVARTPEDVKAYYNATVASNVPPLQLSVAPPSSGAPVSHTVQYYSVDYAGNVETAKNVSFSVSIPPDVTPPTTSSNAVATYIKPSTITLTAVDNVGGWGVANTYYKLDNNATQTGVGVPTSSVVGDHTLKFWSVDAAGNVESAKTATFTLMVDNTPPVTTSNALPSYSPGPAAITLSATDAGWGVANTYYKLDNNATQTGTAINVPAPIAGFASHTIKFWSDDVAGNIETPTSQTFVVFAVPYPMTFSNIIPVEGSIIASAGPFVSATAKADQNITVATATIDGIPVTPTLSWGTTGTAGTSGSATVYGTIYGGYWGPDYDDYEWQDYAQESFATFDFSGYAGATLSNGTLLWNRNYFWTGGDYYGAQKYVYSGNGTTRLGTWWSGDDPTSVGVDNAYLTSRAGSSATYYWWSDAGSCDYGVYGLQAEMNTPRLVFNYTRPGAPAIDYTKMTASFNAVDLPSGKHRASITYTVASGAQNTKTWDFYVDTLPPTTSSDATASYTGTATISLTATDNPRPGGVGVKNTYYRVDSGAQTSGTVVVVAPPASGYANHTIYFWSVDALGNVEATKSAGFIQNALPDTTPPTTVSSAVSTYAAPSSITLTATDNPGGWGVANTYYKLDAGAVTTGTAPVTVVPTGGAGSHTLLFWSVDRAGNKEATKTATYAVTPDVTPPTVTSNYQSQYTGTATITITATDNLGGWGIRDVSYRLDGGATQTVLTPSSTLAVSPPIVGSVAHSLTYWASDFAGNYSAAPTVAFTVNALPAAITFSQFTPPKSGATQSVNPTVSVYGSATTTITGVTALLDGVSRVPDVAYAHTVTGSAGHWEYRTATVSGTFVGNDLLGDGVVRWGPDWFDDESDQAWTCYADFNLAPYATYTLSGGQLAWSFGSTGDWGCDDGQQKWIQQDNGVRLAQWGLLDYPSSASGLGLDQYLNAKKSGVARLIWGSDYGNYYSGAWGIESEMSNPRLTFTYAVWVADTQTTIDDYTKATASYATSNLSQGWHAASFTYTVFNGSQATTSWQFCVDNIPPTTSDNATSTYNGPVSITLTPNDGPNGSGVAATYYKVDGGAQMTGTAVYLSSLAYGSASHTVQYWSVDFAGNKETTKTVSFTQNALTDTTPPTWSGGGGGYYNGGSVSTTITGYDSGWGLWYFSYRLDGGTVTTNTTGAISLTGLAEGYHTVEFWWTDRAGNQSTHGWWNFWIDWHAPVTSTNAISRYTSVANISLTATDGPNGSGVKATYYKLDSGSWTQGISVSIQGPVAGTAPHTLYYYSVDNCNNIEVSKSTTFTIDANPAAMVWSNIQPPELSVQTVRNPGVSITGQAQANITAVTATLDGVAKTPTITYATSSTGGSANYTVAGTLDSGWGNAWGADYDDWDEWNWSNNMHATFNLAPYAGMTISNPTLSWAVAGNADCGWSNGQQRWVSDGSGVTVGVWPITSYPTSVAASTTYLQSMLGSTAHYYWYSDEGDWESGIYGYEYGVSAPSLTFSASGMTFDYTKATASFSTAGLTDGLHTVVMTYTVAGGAQATKTWTFTVNGPDNVPPVTTPIYSPSNVGTATVQLIASDGGGSGVTATYYRLDSGATIAGTPPTTTITIAPPVRNPAVNHTIQFWSVDALGNTESAKTISFTVAPTPDTVAPTTMCSVVPTYTGSASMTLSASDNPGGWGVASTNYQIDGGTQTAWTGVPISVAGPTYGSAVHTIKFWSVDWASNTEVAKTATFTINAVADNTAPVTTSNAQTIYKDPSTITLTVTDVGGWGVAAGSTYYRINGGATTSYVTPIATGSQGSYTLEYWSVDRAGNRETTKTANYVVDQTKPVTTSNALTYYVASASIQLAATDIHPGASGVQYTYYRIDNGTAVSGTNITVAGPVSGAPVVHRIDFWSQDYAGNIEVSKSATFTVTAPADLYPPTTTSNAVPFYAVPSSIALTAIDNVGGWGVAHTYYKLDGGATLEYTLTGTSVVNNGSASFAYTGGAQTFVVPSGVTTLAITINGAGGGGGGAAWDADWYDGSGGGTGGQSSVTYSSVLYAAYGGGGGEGGRCEDRDGYDGSSGGTSSNVGWTSLVGGGAGGGGGEQDGDYWGGSGGSGGRIVGVLAVTPGSTLSINVGAGGYGGDGGGSGANGSVSIAYTITTTIPGGTIGTGGAGGHTLQFWSVDNAGNVETTKSVSYVVDMTPPVTTSTVVPSYTGTATISLTATDGVNGSGVKATYYKVDAGSQTTGTVIVVSPPAFQSVVHTIYYWSVDNMGNSEAQKTATFTVNAVPDNAGPTSWSNAVATYARPTTITISATDNVGGWGVSTIYYKKDGAAAVAGYSTGVGGVMLATCTVNTGGVGSHSLEFWAADLAGNVEAHHVVSYNVSADTTPPVTISNIIPLYWDSASISLTATDNGGWGVDKTYYRLDGGTTSVGTTLSVQGLIAGSAIHTLEFWSTDLAGNTESAHAATFTIAATPANITFSGMLPAEGSTITTASTTIRVRGDSTDTYNITAASMTLDGQAKTPTVAIASKAATVTLSATGLTSGLHTVAVTMTNASGRQATKTWNFTVAIQTDFTPPTTTSNAKDSYIGNAVVSLTATDNVGGTGVKNTYYKVDTGSVTTGTVITVLCPTSGAPVSHTIYFWSVDNAGNVETTRSATFLVAPQDVTPPKSTSDAQPYYNAPSTIQLSATDNTYGSGVAHIYYRLDGAGTIDGTLLGTGGVGSHVLEFWAVDAYGNSETPHNIVSYKVDSTAPITTSDAKTNYVGTAYITLTGTDEVGGSGIKGTYYIIDEAIGRTQGTTATIPPPTSGSKQHTLFFWSVDNAGNIETTKSVSFTVAAPPDETPPVTSSDAKASYAVPGLITLTAVDYPANGWGVATTYWKLDGGIQTEGTTAKTGGVGSHTLEFWSVDKATNVETPHKSASYTVVAADTQSPVTSCTVLPSYTGTATISMTATDNCGVLPVTYYKLDGGALTTGTALTVAPPLSGTESHTLYYRSVDINGNSETTKTASFTVTAQQAYMTFSGVSPVENGTVSARNPLITVTATSPLNNIGLVVFQVDNVTKTASVALNGRVATATLQAVGLLDGPHTVTVTFVDTAGASSVKTWSFTVAGAADLTAPSTTSDRQPYYAGTAVIHLFAADDPAGMGVSGTWYKLDGGSTLSGTPPTSTITVTAAGQHTLEFWSTDSAGNIELPHKSVSFIIDLLPPTTTAITEDAYVGTAAFTLTPTDNTGGSGVKTTYYVVDSGAPATGTAVSVAPPANGSQWHTVYFWSVDNAGNTETSKSVTFNVWAPTDMVAPTTTSDALTDYPVPGVIRLTATDNAGGWGVAQTFYRIDGGAQTTGTIVGTGGAGSHTLEFWSVDLANNVETPHKTVTYTVITSDTQAPDTSSNAAANYTGPAVINLSASDGTGSGVADTYYRLDGGAQTEGTLVGVSGSGSHTLEFWSVDWAGNVETPHKSVTFTITMPDSTPPTTGSNAQQSYIGTATITLAPTDTGGAGVRTTFYRLDGGPAQEGLVIVVGPPIVGTVSHTIEFWSVDNNGNAEGSKFVTFNVSPIPDTVAPVTASNGTNGYNYTDSATILLTATDTGGSGLKATYYRIDNGADTTGTTVVVPGPLSGSAPHTLYYWSVDNQNNRETTKTLTFTITKSVAWTTGTLCFYWSPSGWGEANLAVYNSKGALVNSTYVEGYGEDLVWDVTVPAGDSYYMECSYWYDNDSGDSGSNGQWTSTIQNNDYYRWDY